MISGLRSLLFALLLLAPLAHAQVRVVHGPTPIPGGNANAAGDLTVVNDKLAFALAVESSPPYGLPRGALVDLAPVDTKGVIAHDKIAFGDFIPNNWSAWPNSYQRVRIIRETSKEVVIESIRDWGAVTITTTYALKAGEDQIAIRTTMTNGGEALTGLRSGVTLWPGAGYLFGVPGLEGVEDGPATKALAKRVVAYDETWAIVLHTPYLDHVGFGSKDMYQTHDLKPGESRTFEAWLQVIGSGDLAPATAAEIRRHKLPSAQLSGVVRGADGKPVARPVVVIEASGKPYAWTLGDAQGRYRITLPAGNYSTYATAKARSRTPPVDVALTASASKTLNFTGLQRPGRVRFQVTDKQSGAPLDARIAIEQGEKPLVEFLGRRVFFTELDRKGAAEVTLAPGDYLFSVSWGGGVLATPANTSAEVRSGETTEVSTPINVLFSPQTQGWYAADLHHHADQAEAVTPASDLARAQLAAGLDLLFVSDHDSTVNTAPLQMIADKRGVPFIPSIEISTSWGHFNAFPLKANAALAIDTSNTNVQAVFAEARRMGAGAIQVNHPLIPFGYFSTLQAGTAPGGFDPDFDLVEINSDVTQDDDKVLEAMWDYWNAGKRFYLSAGSDTHDVWNDVTGKVRTYAHVEGELTAASFTEALKAGHAYVTYGPLIFPDHMFGDTIHPRRGETVPLGFDLQSVAGLKQVSLISQGMQIQTKDLSQSGRTARVDFSVTVEKPAWYALVVEDAAGGRAYSNPMWIEATDK